MKEDEAVVRLLLEHKADVSTKDSFGRTALHQAAGKGCDAVMRLLLEHKADVNVMDNYGLTALFWATHALMFRWIQKRCTG
jgi:ankyrin repeat protein